MNKIKTERILEFGIFAILIVTFLFAIKKSPFNYTFSMIGNWFNYRLEFIVWGILTGTFLSFYLIHLFKEIKIKNKKTFWYAYASGIFLTLTVLTPTRIQEPIEKALRQPHLDLHLFWAILFIFFTIATLYTFSKYLSSINKKLSIKSLKLLLITIGGSIAFLTIFGMTGIFEIFFFTALFIYLTIIDKKITKILKPKKNLKNNDKTETNPTRSRSKNNLS